MAVTGGGEDSWEGCGARAVVLACCCARLSGSRHPRPGQRQDEERAAAPPLAPTVHTAGRSGLSVLCCPCRQALGAVRGSLIH